MSADTVVDDRGSGSAMTRLRSVNGVAPTQCARCDAFVHASSKKLPRSLTSEVDVRSLTCASSDHPGVATARANVAHVNSRLQRSNALP
jgi:hypothetical protein